MILNFDLTQIQKQLEFSREYVSDVNDRIKNNDVIADYYKQLFTETGRDRFFALSEDVANCSRLWQFDCHAKLKIMDLVRVQLCHNRFCSNCQKMIQATRMQKFVPVLLATSEYKDLYHMVLTIPNMSAAYLKTHITILFEAFARLVRFLRGTDRIKGVDLKPLGFSAAVRSCEVTFDSDYHPHLHCIIALDMGLNMPKHITHKKFSYSNEGGRRVFKRQFSDFEIFIQKLWQLLIDQIAAKTYKYGFSLADPLPKTNIEYGYFWEHEPKVKRSVAKKDKTSPITLDTIHNLGANSGYSVVIDPIENDSFVQVFKYAFKLQSEDNNLISYDQLKTLYGALLGRKTLQGYGEWYNMKSDDCIDESQDEFWDLFKAYLWQVDRPESVSYTPEEVLSLMDCGDYTFITRRKLQHILEDITVVELMQHKNEIPPVPAKPFSLPDLSGAYYLYWREREKSELFNNLNKVVDPNTGTRILLLNAEQLNFLSSIF